MDFCHNARQDSNRMNLETKREREAVVRNSLIDLASAQSIRALKTSPPLSSVPPHSSAHYHRAFTLIELLITISVISILSSILLPSLSKARARAAGAASLNNTRQLLLAWNLYADDHQGRLPYNLGGTGRNPMGIRSSLNWVNNVLSWELDADNTNSAALIEASLGGYVHRSTTVYRCPTDRTLSAIQRQAGWKSRNRSYAMNAMMGNAGELSLSGQNQNNPAYVQFFTSDSIPRPVDLFVFIEEHSDSINDGYFINRAYSSEWLDLPASDHDRSAPLSFADGHAEMHRWQNSSTLRPSLPDGADLPISLRGEPQQDFEWIISHMSNRSP